MDWQSDILEVIDFRSFQSVWYWIALATAWMLATQRVLGVPYDLVARARRDAAARHRLELLASIVLRRRIEIMDAAGPLLIGLTSAALTACAILGFGYGIDLAQAAFLLLAPLSGLWLADQRTARRLLAQEAGRHDLAAQLRRVRRRTQAVGTVAIFLTSGWGMWRVMTTSPLAG